MIDTILNWLLGLPPWLVLTMAFLFPALEASVFVGVVIPGEIAVLVAGVTASGGRLELWVVIAVAIAGAIIGDFVGFEVGRRWGTALLAKLPERLIKPDHVERGRNALRKRGAIAVLIGRWTAALRALMPGLAGMSDVRFRTFAIANAIGGTIWVAVVAGLGYGAGSSYRSIERILGNTSWIIIGVVALAIAMLLLRHLVRQRPPEGELADAQTSRAGCVPSAPSRPALKADQKYRYVRSDNREIAHYDHGNLVE